MMKVAPLYIARIEVRKLFGLYDYILEETMEIYSFSAAHSLLVWVLIL